MRALPNKIYDKDVPIHTVINLGRDCVCARVCVRERRRDELYLVDIVYRSFHPHAMVINRVELHLRAEHFVSQRATRNT